MTTARSPSGRPMIGGRVATLGTTTTPTTGTKVAAGVWGGLFGGAVGAGFGWLISLAVDKYKMPVRVGGAVLGAGAGVVAAVSNAGSQSSNTVGGPNGLPVNINLATPPAGIFPIPPGSVVNFVLPSGAQWPTSGWATATQGFSAIGAPGSPLTYTGGGGSVTLNWTLAGSPGTATISFDDQ